MKRRFVPLSLLLVILSSVFALLGFELLVRAIGFGAPIWHEADPQLGWRLRPGVHARHTAEGDALVKVNAAGWRDRDHALEKPADVYRIAVLGDSYSEARQVPVEKTFWALLPRQLERCGFQQGRRIEAMNFGVSGYNTAQEFLVLQYRAMRYRPDLVLLQFTNGNDVRGNSRELEPEAERPFFRLGPHNELELDDTFSAADQFRRRASAASALLRAATDRSRLLQMVRAVRERRANRGVPANAVPSVERGLDVSVLRAPQDSQWERAWQLTEALISSARDYAENHGAAFLLVTVPYAIQVHPDAALRRALEEKLGVAHLFYPDQRLTQFAHRQGIAAIALGPDMQPIAETNGIYLHGFPNVAMGLGHWNEDGHRMAAKLIAQRLCGSADQDESHPTGVMSVTNRVRSKTSAGGR